MGACFRLRGGAAGQSHRLCLPETVILPRRYFAPQRSHTEKRRLDGWRAGKVTARLLCAKAAHRKGYGKASLHKGDAEKGGEQRTLSTGTSCAKESHRKAQARWMIHRKGYGKASLRKSGVKKGGRATYAVYRHFMRKGVTQKNAG